MMSPEIKSKKQYIRIWFEFYKLSLLDPDLKDNIEKSSKFYKPWGDVSNIKFDEWWKTSKPLFVETLEYITTLSIIGSSSQKPFSNHLRYIHLHRSDICLGIS